MGKKGRGKKGRTQRHNAGLKDTEPDELKRAPHSFVVGRGKTGRYVNQLVLNFRRVMEPFTASSLRLKKSRVRDLASVAGHLSVSHVCLFSRTERAIYLKLGRFPRGPTITFRVENYTLTRDVLSSLRRQVTYAKQFSHAPLLILNNLSASSADSQQQHLQLVATTLQNMFPSINIHKVQLRNLRRVVLFSYCPQEDTISFRHYTVKMTPSGVSRGVRRLVTNNKLPNMARMHDIAEYVARSGCASDSEAEEDGDNCVQLPQAIGSRGNNTPLARSAVRLIELGPRLTLTLTKIQSGLTDGDMLYHRFVEKSSEQIAAIKEKRNRREQLKLERKRQQEMNVQKKAEIKEQLKQKSLAGQKTHTASDAKHVSFAPQTSKNDVDNSEDTTADDGQKMQFVRRRPVSGRRTGGRVSSNIANKARRTVIMGSKIRKKTKQQ